MSRIVLVFCLLLVSQGCSDKNNEKKIFRTAILPDGVPIYPSLERQSEIIAKIPFKSEVEIIDNKVLKDDYEDELFKIKYVNTIGYVRATLLSEKKEMPFNENIKYDLNLNEFSYDKIRIMKFVKKVMLAKTYTRYDASYYYINDPQILLFHGKTCDNFKAKKIAVIIKSKLHENFNEVLWFHLSDNKMIVAGAMVSVDLTKETLIEGINQIDTDCCGGCG